MPSVGSAPLTESNPQRLPSRWSGLSTDERRRERCRLLVDSAFELLGEEGANATTVRGICARARLNPRYFYESFDGLDSLMVAVYDSVVDQLRAEVGSAVLSAEGSPAAVRAAVEATVRFVDRDRRRGRILFVEALGNETLNVHRVQTGFGLVELVQRDTGRRRSGSGSEQVDRLSAAMLVGGFGEILAAWLDDRIQMTADELIDTTTSLFVAVGDAAPRVAG
jgi:AcrR family transcriptional regulator